MNSFKYFIYDIKQIVDDGIIIVLFLMPAIFILAVNPLITFLRPILVNYAHIDILMYYEYVMTVTYLLLPGILGTVIGFMMLDDKDGKIYELMSVTPLGNIGYFMNRISLASVMLVIYSFMALNILGYVRLSLDRFIVLMLFLFIENITLALIIFHFADDKVKGLTYSKLINFTMVFGCIELFNNKLLNAIANVFPQYWVNQIIMQGGFAVLFKGLVVHLIWFYILLRGFLKVKKI